MVIVELDGKRREEFDFIDQFIADYAICIEKQIHGIIFSRNS